MRKERENIKLEFESIWQLIGVVILFGIVLVAAGMGIIGLFECLYEAIF